MHLDRLITILELIAMAGRGLSAVEVQKATGLPRPTCYRLLQTLAENRLIDDPGGSSRYVIGERLIGIALLGQSDIDVRRVCAPVLREAALNLEDSVFLARLRSTDVEIIHVETPSNSTHGFIHPGFGVRPMHACSCSKAIAAFAKQSFQENILSGMLNPYTPHTKTTRAALEAEFAAIVQQGYAECHEEIDIGVSSVAAPVFVGATGTTFSVGAVGPVRRFTKQYRKRLGEDLIAISAKLGAAIQLCAVSQDRIADMPRPTEPQQKAKQLPNHH
ncbi:IclR family transcriptional regulator [Roseobacter denitrificans]|uniref:Transcriptional regulator, IclR family, putative n=1 Tax=Roseobacter denitrificans (strain ATCC 33942 / OCh 114) TaxID=375451 RepID=Q166Z4_ROSDO|nr:IclR family transcriptional regulator [Roseobacter denitrificans]ABG31949.1 transcriptional regulator, IclR family, putative [Roseobacter denitrificans OCh 114]SFG35100.1 transcriptional regulator, IclR family [Roseobacter denitrificans OCh 114]